MSKASTSPLRVGIVEDQQHIREGLRELIDGSEGFRCAGCFPSMEEAIRNLEKDMPELMLVDIGLPGISGIEGIRTLKARYSQLSFVVLTVYEDDERIFDALCAGANGYLLKNTDPGKLLESLQEAKEGGAPMSPQVARRVIRLFQEIRPPKKSEYHLTPHENRLLKMLVDGHNYKSAGKELGVSVNTIAFHIKSIYGKLQVHSKSEAVAKALRDRLV